jgi:hypothetical protein
MNIKKLCTELYILSSIHNVDLNDLIKEKVNGFSDFNSPKLMSGNIKNNFSSLLNYFELPSSLINDLDEEILKKFRLTEKDYSKLTLYWPEEVIISVIVIKSCYYSEYGDDYNFSPLVYELNNYLKEYNSYNKALIVYDKYKNTYHNPSDKNIVLYEYYDLFSDSEETFIDSKNIRSNQFYLTCYVLNELLIEVRSRLKKASIIRNEYGQYEFNKPQCVLGLLISEIYITPNLIEENSSKIEFVRNTVSIFDVIGKHNFNLYRFKDREKKREELVNSLKGGLSNEKKCKKTIEELVDGEYEEIKEVLINILREKAIIKSEK